MQIGEAHVGQVLVLRPKGRIDGSTSAEFTTRLLRAVADAAAGVIVDFAGVDYISSAGLRALMSAVKQRTDRRLAVTALSPVVQEIFRIARFQHVVRIFDSVDEAAAAFGATP